MRGLLLIAFCMTISWLSLAQVVNTASMDSADYVVNGKFTIEGYVDSYYAYNFNEPDQDIPYFVSMARHNEFNINLAFADLKYSSQRLRARVVPGFGTYVNANYSNEPGPLKNLVEANAGIRVFKNKDIWVDAGVLGSPYTNESALSKDHLAYTRSLAAENVPYYLSGVKATFPLSGKVTAYLFLLNGWQQIQDQNSNKAFGSQVEIRPGDNLLINWNTYVGKERAAIDSMEGNRYFSDVYFIFRQARLSMTGCLYYGIQEHSGINSDWMQGNLITKYQITPAISSTIRVEYFQDADGVLIIPLVPTSKYETFGASLGVDFKVENNVLFRTEARQLISTDKIHLNHGSATEKSLTLAASLCAWF